MNFIVKDSSSGNIRFFYGNSIYSIKHNPNKNFIEVYFTNYAMIKLKGKDISAAAQMLQQEFIHGTTTVDLTHFDLYEVKREAENSGTEQ